MKNKKWLILTMFVTAISLAFIFGVEPVDAIEYKCVGKCVGEKGINAISEGTRCFSNPIGEPVGTNGCEENESCCVDAGVTIYSVPVDIGAANATVIDCRCFTEAQGKLFETKLSQVDNENSCRQSCISNEATSFKFGNDSAKSIEETNKTLQNTDKNIIGNAVTDNASCPSGICEFVNPLGANDVTGLLTGLLTTLRGIVGIIAIIMIVIGGMIYMFAGVDEKNVELAKKMIGGSVIGLAIIVAAPAFLKELLAVLSPTNGVAVDPSVANAPTLKLIAERILQFLLSIVGILGIIGLIVGGGFYMTAYGDEERMKKGKTIITTSMIGILVAMAALVIVRQIAVLLG